MGSENDGNKRAIVLLSGGLDSTTVLALARNRGFAVYALTFRYGQKNQFELSFAEANAKQYGAIDHRIVEIDLAAFGGSSLTTAAKIERGRSREEIGRKIPSTYVPARNTIFLSFALAWADVLGISDIFIGVNALDSSGYPDCRPEYITTFQKLAALATRLGTEEHQPFTIHTPLIELNKAGIVKLGTSLEIDYSQTSTCYDPSPKELACGTCDSCTLRQLGFLEAGLVDPLPYQVKLTNNVSR